MNIVHCVNCRQGRSRIIKMEELKRESVEELWNYQYSVQKKLFSKWFDEQLDEKLDRIESRIKQGYTAKFEEHIALAADNKELQRQLKVLQQLRESDAQDAQRRLQEVQKQMQAQKEAELADIQEKLQTQQKEIQKQLADKQIELTYCKEQKKVLEEEVEKQQTQLKKISEKYSAVDEQMRGYYRACREDVSKVFPFVKTQTYESYLISLCKERNIMLIYDKMKQEYEYRRDGAICRWDWLIDEYIELSGRIGNQGLRRQEPQVGQLYESAQFDKVFGSKENGEITKVIYKGLENDGEIIVKALVEVEM